MTATRTPHARPRRLSGDDGSALIEFAMVAPFIVFLGMWLSDYGFALREDNNVQRAAQNAARTASNVANGGLADYMALQSVYASTGNMSSTTTLQMVVIYKANGITNGTPPSSCTSLTPSASSAVGVSGLCNVYSATQTKTTSFAGFPLGSSSSPSCPSGSWAVNWCPSSRVRDGSADTVGVYVKFQYSSITGLMPGRSATLTAYGVYKLEPTPAGG
jgi:Flp pilus assembly protein TadG